VIVTGANQLAMIGNVWELTVTPTRFAVSHRSSDACTKHPRLAIFNFDHV
jgi:hypothetical protein